uniref:Uncharacterized protein n=1 Tax=Chromera velia CCMP2878 TaxID=1169474 RepID=A0A0G4FW06_9ALVE|eukprot:Cvel_18914.t1-p1 / transcript=Cvel_18914.t1 / gene=Cvel_18914 / organism=Chromera_velia_CCMP2878 / gene_product=hypothetical protein / transcript_product=hypothetical protein / location=Cvel_scaffold1594:16828-25381(-) / protein_length=1864 / sequence_SO=supercontig / SO=protein_coding / is_pseudo=false
MEGRHSSAPSCRAICWLDKEGDTAGLLACEAETQQLVNRIINTVQGRLPSTAASSISDQGETRTFVNPEMESVLSLPDRAGPPLKGTERHQSWLPDTFPLPKAPPAILSEVLAACHKAMDQEYRRAAGNTPPTNIAAQARRLVRLFSSGDASSPLAEAPSSNPPVQAGEGEDVHEEQRQEQSQKGRKQRTARVKRQRLAKTKIDQARRQKIAERAIAAEMKYRQLILDRRQLRRRRQAARERKEKARLSRLQQAIRLAEQRHQTRVARLADQDQRAEQRIQRARDAKQNAYRARLSAWSMGMLSDFDLLDTHASSQFPPMQSKGRKDLGRVKRPRGPPGVRAPPTYYRGKGKVLSHFPLLQTHDREGGGESGRRRGTRSSTNQEAGSDHTEEYLAVPLVGLQESREELLDAAANRHPLVMKAARTRERVNALVGLKRRGSRGTKNGSSQFGFGELTGRQRTRSDSIGGKEKSPSSSRNSPEQTPASPPLSVRLQLQAKLRRALEASAAAVCFSKLLDVQRLAKLKREFQRELLLNGRSAAEQSQILKEVKRAETKRKLEEKQRGAAERRKGIYEHQLKLREQKCKALMERLRENERRVEAKRCQRLRRLSLERFQKRRKQEERKKRNNALLFLRRRVHMEKIHLRAEKKDASLKALRKKRKKELLMKRAKEETNRRFHMVRKAKLDSVRYMNVVGLIEREERRKANYLRDKATMRLGCCALTLGLRRYMRDFKETLVLTPAKRNFLKQLIKTEEPQMPCASLSVAHTAAPSTVGSGGTDEEVVQKPPRADRAAAKRMLNTLYRGRALARTGKSKALDLSGMSDLEGQEEGSEEDAGRSLSKCGFFDGLEETKRGEGAEEKGTAATEEGRPAGEGQSEALEGQKTLVVFPGDSQLEESRDSVNRSQCPREMERDRRPAESKTVSLKLPEAKLSPPLPRTRTEGTMVSFSEDQKEGGENTKGQNEEKGTKADGSSPVRPFSSALATSTASAAGGGKGGDILTAKRKEEEVRQAMVKEAISDAGVQLFMQALLGRKKVRTRHLNLADLTTHLEKVEGLDATPWSTQRVNQDDGTHQSANRHFIWLFNLSLLKRRIALQALSGLASSRPLLLPLPQGDETGSADESAAKRHWTAAYRRFSALRRASLLAFGVGPSALSFGPPEGGAFPGSAAKEERTESAESKGSDGKKKGGKDGQEGGGGESLERRTSLPLLAWERGSVVGLTKGIIRDPNRIVATARKRQKEKTFNQLLRNISAASISEEEEGGAAPKSTPVRPPPNPKETFFAILASLFRHPVPRNDRMIAGVGDDNQKDKNPRTGRAKTLTGQRTGLLTVTQLLDSPALQLATTDDQGPYADPERMPSCASSASSGTSEGRGGGDASELDSVAPASSHRSKASLKRGVSPHSSSKRSQWKSEATSTATSMVSDSSEDTESDEATSRSPSTASPSTNRSKRKHRGPPSVIFPADCSDGGCILRVRPRTIDPDDILLDDSHGSIPPDALLAVCSKDAEFSLALTEEPESAAIQSLLARRRHARNRPHGYRKQAGGASRADYGSTSLPDLKLPEAMRKKIEGDQGSAKLRETVASVLSSPSLADVQKIVKAQQYAEKQFLDQMQKRQRMSALGEASLAAYETAQKKGQERSNRLKLNRNVYLPPPAQLPSNIFSKLSEDPAAFQARSQRLRKKYSEREVNGFLRGRGHRGTGPAALDLSPMRRMRSVATLRARTDDLWSGKHISRGGCSSQRMLDVREKDKGGPGAGTSNMLPPLANTNTEAEKGRARSPLEGAAVRGRSHSSPKGPGGGRGEPLSARTRLRAALSPPPWKKRLSPEQEHEARTYDFRRSSALLGEHAAKQRTVIRELENKFVHQAD